MCLRRSGSRVAQRESTRLSPLIAVASLPGWVWRFSSCRTMIALGWPAASKLSQVYFGGTK